VPQFLGEDQGLDCVEYDVVYMLPQNQDEVGNTRGGPSASLEEGAEGHQADD